MVVKQSHLGEALRIKNMNDYITDEEADETLSLSDLPLYGSDQSAEESEWKEEDLSSESQDYFEFFSQELSPPTTTFPPETFIFCGKTIPYRNADASENIVESEDKQTSIKKKRGVGGIFRWKFSSKNGKEKESTTLMQKKDDRRQPSTKKYNSEQHGKGYGFPLHKMPILTSASSGKARWYLFLFGISRFSSEMELSDIKSRQSRHGQPPLPTTRVLDSHDEKVTGGLSKLITALSCGRNHHPNSMVVESINHNRLN